jgi:hypothetical protein
VSCGAPHPNNRRAGETPLSATGQYRFTYNLASDASAADFVMKASLLLQGIGIVPEINATDAGGFIRVDILVREDLGTVASFRLMPLNRNLASQGADKPH